jgi:nicotinate-nucleotide--dimethylbenzimidazole phosphoribosyltransferase
MMGGVPLGPPPADAELPVDAVVFAPDAVVDPAGPEPDAAPRPRPGIRRLADALARRGVTPHVLTPRHQGETDHGGALADHLAAAGLGPDRVTLVDADATVAGTSRARTLIVTASPEMASGMTAAGHPVVVLADRPAHHALLAWLADRIGPFAAAAALAGPLDDDAADASRQRQLRLTGDHGVHGQGVTPWPQEVTGQMVANFLAGGAAVNVLARQVGSEVVVVDVGMAGDVAGGSSAARLLPRKVRPGTADLATGPAMTLDEARRALDVGADVAADLVARGARCLVTGDMGIANTTPAAALVASLTERPASAVTGRGTGVDDHLLTRKTALVAAAAARARYEHGTDPLAILAEVGGLEHAALAGFIVGGAALQVPVVVDGVIAASGLLVASRLAPGVEACVIAGHRSVEPGASAVLDHVGLDPVVDLDMRLGEGTGALLALPLVEAAARILHEMATFDQAGVTSKDG